MAAGRQHFIRRNFKRKPLVLKIFNFLKKINSKILRSNQNSKNIFYKVFYFISFNLCITSFWSLIFFIYLVAVEINHINKNKNKYLKYNYKSCLKREKKHASNFFFCLNIFFILV